MCRHAFCCGTHASRWATRSLNQESNRETWSGRACDTPSSEVGDGKIPDGKCRGAGRFFQLDRFESLVRVRNSVTFSGDELGFAIAFSDGIALPRRLPRLATPWTHLSLSPYPGHSRLRLPHLRHVGRPRSHLIRRLWHVGQSVLVSILLGGLGPGIEHTFGGCLFRRTRGHLAIPFEETQ